MREKIFDLTISLVAMFLAIMLIGLFAWISYWVIGVENMGSIEKFMDAFSGAFFFLVKLFVLWIALIFLGMFVLWLFKDEGMIILPFEVATGEDGYSGKSISDLLTAELRRIKRIHEDAKNIQPMGLKLETSTSPPAVPVSKDLTRGPIASGSSSGSRTTLTLPPVVPRSENFAYKVAEAGAVRVGPAWVLIGPLLSSLKQLWPGGDTEQVITGSLQKYGLVICLVAHLEHHEIRAWEVRHEIRPQDKVRDEQIPFMVRDLAFKIAKGLSSEQEDGQAKTWRGLKHITEAWDAYYRYTLTEDEMELERAQESCLLAAKAEVGYEEPFNLLLNLGAAYIKNKKYVKAEKLFRQAVDIKPDSEAFYGLGFSLYHLHKYENAIDYFDKAIELNLEDAYVWNSKGAVLNDHLDKHEDALKCFNKAIELDPQFAGAWYNRGVALDDLGSHEDAIESYKMAIGLSSENLEEIWYNLGNAFGYLDMYEEAIESYNESVYINPQFARSWYNRGNALQHLGEHEEAIASYDEVIKLDPRHIGAWINRGLAFANLRMYKKAIESYDNVIKLNPQEFEDVIWTNKGNAFGNWGKYEEALRCFKRAIELNPQYAEAWHSMGIALDKLDRHDEAVEAYEKAIELGLTSATLHVTLARLYRKLGREAESVVQCRKARALIENEDEYNRACFEAVCGSADDALALLRSALEKNQIAPEWARQDPDFEFIRDDPRFEELLDEFSEGEESGSG